MREPNMQNIAPPKTDLGQRILAKMRPKHMSDQRPLTDKERAFLEDVVAVCKKHGMSISHEDGHGGFLVEPFSEFNVSWLMDAYYREPEPVAAKEPLTPWPPR